MKHRQYGLWLAHFGPALGTEPEKTRPVVIVQTDLLNDFHPSTIICPITTNVKLDVEILRLHLTNSQLSKSSDILVDQIRAIDNKRFIKKLGKLTKVQISALQNNLKIVLDI